MNSWVSREDAAVGTAEGDYRLKSRRTTSARSS